MQSNADVIAHEIAHSWTGNLVTNKSFEHFWLNEGFTVFVERKIQESCASAELFFFFMYYYIMLVRDAPDTGIRLRVKT